MKTIQKMLVEPTAHHLCDSGSIYGRNYQRNAERDFSSEPQAKLSTKYGWPEVTVNTSQHLEACLEEDDLCVQFNNLDCDDWNSDFYGTSAEQSIWLEDHGFVPEGGAWNSYNWENAFDQTLQGQRFERDGEEYVLLQIHGGCDVRSGYTDAKLFKIQDWTNDYFMLDDCRFDLDRKVAEAAGYPVTEITPHGYDSDWLSLDFRNGYEIVIYDPRLSDEVDVPKNFWERLPELNLEGVQNAIEH